MQLWTAADEDNRGDMSLMASRPSMMHMSRMETPYQQELCWWGLRAKREVAAANWPDLVRRLEDLNDQDCAAVLNYPENKESCTWLPPFSSQPSPVIIDNQGSGDFGSYSSGSSDRTSSGFLDNGSGSTDATSSLSSYLMDGNVRAMLKKVTVNEAVLNRAIQSLGGGEKGLKGLMGYIMLWVKERNGGSGEFLLPQDVERQFQQVTPQPSLNLTPDQQANDGFYHFNEAMQQPSAAGGEMPQEVPHLHRLKSRRLMGEDRSQPSFCPSIFLELGGNISGSDLGGDFIYPKLETGAATSPGCTMGQPFLQTQSEDEMQQQVSSMQSALGYAWGQTNEANNKSGPSLAATTRAARKHRLARQRQSMTVQQHSRNTGHAAVAVSPGCGSWGVAGNTGNMLRRGESGMFHAGSQIPLGGALSSGRKGCNMESLTFLLQKELRPSDVGNLGRIILPKKEAEMHLPFLAAREGLSIQMEDFDSCILWNIRYRFWPNNKSRMYLLENTGEFVKSHHLEEGDLLILYRNQHGNYVLRGRKKKSRSEESAGVQNNVAHSLAKVFPEEVTPKVEDLLTERICGGAPPERYGRVKSEPVGLDDDPFFKDVLHHMGSSFGCGGLLHPLERFPSLTLDFPLDEMMPATPKTEPGTVAAKSSNLEQLLVAVPKAEPS